MAVTIEYGNEREQVAYDLVVVATGFQSRWFEGLFGEQARGRLAEALAGAALEQRIDVDLSVRACTRRYICRWWPAWRRAPASPT